MRPDPCRPRPSPRRRRGALTTLGALALLAGALGTPALHAQAVGGRVVDAASGRAVPGAPVRLLRAVPNDSAVPADTTPLAGGVTAPDGVFLLLAPGPGTYRVRIGDAFLTPAVTLASADTTDAREYRLTTAAVRRPDGSVLRGAALDSALRTGKPFFEFQVERIAQAVPGTGIPRYPEEMRQRGVGGSVLAQFVVDAAGHADMATFRVLRATDPAFIDAVRTAVADARFYPAELGGHTVKQLVQQPFTFRMAGATPAALPLSPPPFRPVPPGGPPR